MKKHLPNGWKELQIKDVLDYERPDLYIVKNNIYKDKGVAVLTANKSFILGYTDEKDNIYNNIPVIIFDDFTTETKYVNFPFKVKSSAIKILKSKKGYNLKFIYEVLNIISFNCKVHKRYYISEYQNLNILVPPLDEQKRIADILSTFDDLIENLKKLIEKKELYKKGVMQRVLSGKVRFNGFKDEWETVKLGDIATITSAGVDKKINDNETKVRLLNYLDVFNRNKLYDNEISFITSANENQIKKCDIKKGDLFITPSSEDREGIAKSAVAMEDFTNVVYSYHIIRLRFNREIDLKFKSYMCDTALFHRQAYRLCDGSGQRYVISLGTFREMEIYIPKSIDEQKKIGELLTLIDKDIEILKRLLYLRKLQKKGVMQKLLTGEVRV